MICAQWAVDNDRAELVRANNARLVEAERRMRAEGQRPPGYWAPLNGKAWRDWDEAVALRALRMLRGER